MPAWVPTFRGVSLVPYKGHFFASRGPAAKREEGLVAGMRLRWDAGAGLLLQPLTGGLPLLSGVERSRRAPASHKHLM